MSVYDSLGAQQEPKDDPTPVGEDFKGKDLFSGDIVYELEGYQFKADDLPGVLNLLDKDILLDILDCFRNQEIISRCGIERDYSV
ncbi:hypothetical protein ACWOAH_10320 [Vagococcus vulneris]|uniref:Uncharacterized protein n=1 Tax=Vagococcus vulneris TaxID=1977869 RepID=A0A429ZTI7_9ENTE|nr:hypothetical protein [Vagococcus vulneris]RST96972.1 hypothetical protein CBF37_10480 [Vagococcus vulneris]